MSNDKKVKEHLIARMKQCELYANYWIASAVTGTCTNRKIYSYDKHDYLSPDELRQEAMDTAKTHIQNFNEAMNDLMGLDDEVFS
jgi:hypothetical protein